MESVKPRTRQELVAKVLRTCALDCDPRNGRLKSVADLLAVHETTISGWIAQGYVPEFQVRKLQKCFGTRTVSLDDLCPVEFRRS